MNKFGYILVIVSHLLIIFPKWAEASSSQQYYPEDFTRFLGFTAAVLAPDASYVYGIKRFKEKTALVSYRLSDGYISSTNLNGLLPRDPITRMSLLNTDLALLQSQAGYLYTYRFSSTHFSRLFNPTITMRTRFFYASGPYAAPKVEHHLPRDPEHILLSHLNNNFQRVVSYLNLKNGTLNPAIPADPKVLSWFVDRDGVIRGKSVREKNRIDYYYRLTKNSDWLEMDKGLPFDRDKQLQFSLFKETVAGRGQVFMGFGERPNEVYFASNHKTDTMALYRADLGESKPPQLVYHNPQYDIASAPGNIKSSGLYYSPFNKGVAGLIYEAEKTKMVSFQSDFTELQAELAAHFPDEQITIPIDFDDLGRYWLIFSYAPHDPGRYFLFDRENKSAKLIFGANQYLDPRRLSRAEPFEYTGSEGQRIQGYFYAPNIPHPAEGYPTVVLIHGGPWARDTYTFNPQVQTLAAAGYAVLQVNFRGSAGLGFKHLSASAKNYGAAAVKDIYDATIHFIDKGLIDRNKCALMGFSYGAYAGIYLLAEYPDTYCAAVAGAGPFDLLAMTKKISKQKTFRRIAFEHWQQMVGTNSRSDREALAAQSPINMLDKVRAPIFLYHGLVDPVVAPTQSEAMASRLKDKNKEFNYFPLRGVGHSFGSAEQSNALHHHILKFLNVHLK